MTDSSAILRRLERHLKRGGASGPRPRVASFPATTDGGDLVRIEETFGPGQGGFPDELFGADFDWPGLVGRLASTGGLGRVAFWDLETCGLGDELIFLIGVLTLQPETGADMASPLRLDLLLARDPAAEPRLLREGAALLAGAGQWVSFNGRSFDHPRLRKRADRHGIDLPAAPRHLDLLLEVRRRWKGDLPDCRLGTVERRLLGLERGPRDIPGREVPERYRDYVATGERRWLDPVIEHNRRDVIAMAALFGKLLALDASLLDGSDRSRHRRGASEVRLRPYGTQMS